MEATSHNPVSHTEILSRELEMHQKRHPGYSLRAFARHLGLSAAQLSRVLSLKRPLTTRLAMRLAERLDLSPLQKAQWLGSVSAQFEPIPGVKGAPRVRTLAEDEFRLVADWFHFAILSLGDVPGNRADPAWIGRRLGIPERVAREAFERLQRLDLVEGRGKGFRPSGVPLSTTTDVPSAAIRRYHKQNLELATEKLQTVPVELREFTSITIAVDRSKIPAAKAAMRTFKRQLAAELKTGRLGDVYTLSLQLFPVTDVTGSDQPPERDERK